MYRHEPDSYLLPDVPLMIPRADLDRYNDELADYLERLKQVRTLKVTTKLPLFNKSYYRPIRRRLRYAVVAAAKVGSRVVKNIQVPDLIDGDKANCRWVFKSIESLGRMGAFARARPESRFIHIIRHPCGVTGSILRAIAGAKFTSDTPIHEDWGIYEMLAETDEAREYGIDMDRLRGMHPVERTAWNWVLLNEKALNDTRDLPNCKAIRYEDLCERPIETSKELFDFAGLHWHRQTEGFLDQSTSSEQSSYYSVYKDPLKAAMKWKHEMHADDIARVFDVIAETQPGRLFPRDTAEQTQTGR
ncbi:hypothetical protein ABI59_19335 [Acidobacteria bacterium Mor1]|nr:hypothetical protein ABI59_19335 [Acidobacteria bacterium Mor1]